MGGAGLAIGPSASEAASGAAQVGSQPEEGLAVRGGAVTRRLGDMGNRCAEVKAVLLGLGDTLCERSNFLSAEPAAVCDGPDVKSLFASPDKWQQNYII